MKTFITKKVEYMSFLLRVLLGMLIIPAGFNMVLNYHATLVWLTEGTLHLPVLIAYFIIAAEFYASFFLIIGLGSRFMAGILGIILIAAIPSHDLAQLTTGWIEQMVGQGYPFHILAIGSAIILVFTGSGRLSLDGAIERLLCREKLKTCAS